MDTSHIDKLISEGKFDDALVWIGMLLDTSPNSVQLLMLKAKTLIAKKQESEAIPVLAKVLSVDHVNILAAKLLSRLYAVVKDSENSEKYAGIARDIEQGKIAPQAVAAPAPSPAPAEPVPPPAPVVQPKADRVIIKQSGSGDSLVMTGNMAAAVAAAGIPHEQEIIMTHLMNLVKVPNMEGAMLSDIDGLPIKYYFQDKSVDFDSLAAITQAIIRASRDMLNNIGMSDVSSVLVSLSEQLILIASEDSVVLSTFVHPSANLGLVKLETKRTLDKIVAALHQT